MTANEALFPYLQQNGSHCMAYTSLEPQMEYFILEDVGYIAYISFKHWFFAWKERKVVLADPVCDPQNYQTIISAFIKKYPGVIFVQTSKSTASVLDKLGYQVNLFGIENEIPLADFTLQGKPRAKLRQWRNKCVREGVTVKEVCISACDNLDEVKALSNVWLKKKGGDDLGFLVRPFRF